jgi:hypothetical protein
LQLYESGVVLDLKSLLVQGNGRAIRYGIGVSRDGFQWSDCTRFRARPNGQTGRRVGSTACGSTVQYAPPIR